jgi:uncharacterized protein YxjI
VSTDATNDPAGILEAVEGSNRFLIQQVFRPIGNEYRISVPTAGSSEEGEPLLFVKQKKLSIREDIRFRVDPDADAHLFMIKAKTAFEFRGRHDVLAADGSQIGLLEKDFARSLIRSHWRVRDPAGSELFESHEASWPIAIVRRIAGVLPEIGELFTWIPFNFVLLRDGRQVGTYKRVLGKFRDRYVLELEPDLEDVDRRLVLAFAIGLDSLQDR